MVLFGDPDPDQTRQQLKQLGEKLGFPVEGPGLHGGDRGQDEAVGRTDEGQELVGSVGSARASPSATKRR
jgi:hypothetical protein